MRPERVDENHTLDERRGPKPSHPETASWLETTWPRDVERTVTETVWLRRDADPGWGEGLQGTRLGPYRIARPIGRGGMATVYLAFREDGVYRKRVAVKVISSHTGEDDLDSRFRAERQILADLDHPNIARLVDGGTTPEGRPFMVMEHVDGLPIDEHCKRCRLSVGQRVELFHKVCRVVDHAHRNHVVHRDVKPRNILVTADGVVKLLDFGIAKLLLPRVHEHPVNATSPGLQPMTPGYASPEQICGAEVTPASDVYALGLLAYKLLTDRLPFKGSGRRDWRLEWMECFRKKQLPLRPSVAANLDGKNEVADVKPVRRRAIPPDLDAIVLKALRLEPEHRYPTAGELAEDVSRYLAGRPVRARKGSFAYRVRKGLGRHRQKVFTTFLLLLTIWLTGLYFLERRARLEAEERGLTSQVGVSPADRLDASLQDHFCFPAVPGILVP